MTEIKYEGNLKIYQPRIIAKITWAPKPFTIMGKRYTPQASTDVTLPPSPPFQRG